MNKNVQKLISDIMTSCIKNEINFRLEYVDQVDQENIPCSGYFDEETLAVATKKERMQDWLYVLVHESCRIKVHQVQSSISRVPSLYLT